jgi:membrane-associated phospholipid phosphatase
MGEIRQANPGEQETDILRAMAPSLRSTPLRLNRPLGALGAILLVVLSALVIDPYVAVWATHIRCPLLDTLVGLLNPIGGGVVLLVVCVILAMLSFALGRSQLCAAAGFGALAFAAAGLVEFSLKHLVGRPRPDAALPALAFLGPSFVPDVDSFPSGHATSVFAVATVFAAFYPRIAWLLYALAGAIAAGRVYLERHYVSDVLGGATIAIVIASALLRSRGRLSCEG